MRKKLIKTRNRPALTLVEMLVAMIMVTIILSAAAVTMIYGQRSLDREWEQVGIQREASYAMLTMKQAIRGASQAQIVDDGKGFKVYKNGQWIEFKYDPDEGNIRYQTLETGEEWDDDKARALVDVTVKSAYFSIDTSTNSTVTISLYLKDGEFESQIVSSVTMRNFIAGS